MKWSGTYWDDRELNFLKISFELEVPVEETARKLHRKPAACTRKYRELVRYGRFYKPGRVG